MASEKKTPSTLETIQTVSKMQEDLIPVPKVAPASPKKGILSKGWNVFTVKNAIIVAFLLVAFSVVQTLRWLGWISGPLDDALALICVYIVLGVSLNLITGFTGQFSLGHAGFMAIGAYTTAILMPHLPPPLTLALPFATITIPSILIGILPGALLAMLLGVIIGLPTLRLKGDYLAIATLGMAEIIRVVFMNLEITGGAAGLFNFTRAATFPVLFIVMVISVVVIYNFIRSSRGRACIAIREDEIAAESMGINSTKYKVMAFALGAFFGGIGGGLYSSYFYVLKPGTFSFLMSVNILVIVVFGGLGSISGSVVSAIVITAITQYFTTANALNVFGLFSIEFSRVNNIIYALLLIAIMLFRPQGLMGTMEINDLIMKAWGAIKRPFQRGNKQAG
ncbi:MAG: branched-chain amino acid ABC transporter permease [Actinomycetia bacterium]|nr:branched-chain amino acid ABC transporter permease [Actinomycetes bacterium]